MCSVPASDITNAKLIKKPTVANKTKLPMLDEIIDSTQYSKLDKLLGVTAYVQHHACRHKNIIALLAFNYRCNFIYIYHVGML